jgi:hypothetical protein
MLLLKMRLKNFRMGSTSGHQVPCHACRSRHVAETKRQELHRQYIDRITKVLIEYLSVFHRRTDDFLFATINRALPDSDLRKMVYVKSMPFRIRSEYDFFTPAYLWGLLPIKLRR